MVTGRDATHLSAAYGYDSVSALAAALPERARVLDAGAGLSNFGKVVASMRPDITWVNYDLCYSNTWRYMAEARRGAPDNVTYVQGDIMVLPTAAEDGGYNAIFSYWALPHIQMQHSRQYAIMNMIKAARAGAHISLGPIFEEVPWHPGVESFVQQSKEGLGRTVRFQVPEYKQAARMYAGQLALALRV